MKPILELGKSKNTEIRRLSSRSAWKWPTCITRWVGIASMAVALLTFTITEAIGSESGAILGPLSWSSVSNLPVGRALLAAASVNGKIYAMGGWNGAAPPFYYPTVYAYDLTQPTLGWSSVSNLPLASDYLAAAVVDGKIYAIGGNSNLVMRSAVYVYDASQPTQGWLSVSNLPVARCDLAAVSANGKIYAIGGLAGYDYTNSQSMVCVYDPSQPTLGWLNVSNLPAARRDLAAASVNGKIYAIGGYDGTNSQSTVYVYDPSQPTLGWLNVSNLPAARGLLAAASVNGKIYAIAGYNGTSPHVYSTVYVYDPAQPLLGWLSMSNLPMALEDLAAVSENGKIYAIGGNNNLPPYFYSTVYEGSFANGVVPSSGPLAGGNAVTISGSYLGSGDVTSVTLCGVATSIVSDNSPTQIVVRAGAAAVPVTGDVVVNSTSYGVTVKSNAYTYFQLPTITNMMAFDGAHLQLSWPTNYLGWELQAQTNPMGAGIGTNWFPVADSTTTNQLLILINPTNPSVFYRLHGL